MRGVRTLGRAIGAAMGALVLATAAQAATASHPYGSFIEPGATTPLQNSGPLCASTALINSFVFLDNTYSIYDGTRLTRGQAGNTTLEDARDELCGVIG